MDAAACDRPAGTVTVTVTLPVAPTPTPGSSSVPLFTAASLATNARDQLVVSVEAGGEALVEVLSRCGVDAKVEESFEAGSYYDVVSDADLRGRYCTYPLAQQFVSLYLTVGHAKSTLGKDEAFVAAFSASAKWLRVVE